MPTIIRSFVDSCFCWIIINNVKLSSRTILGQAIRGLPRKIVFVPYVIDDQKTHIGRQEIDCIGPYIGNGICKVHHWYHHHNRGRVAEKFHTAFDPAPSFSEGWGMGINGHSEPFQKFIRFGTLTRPLQEPSSQCVLF